MPGGKDRPQCSVQSCKRLNKGHSFCTLHLRRWKRTGDPEGLLNEQHGQAGQGATKEYWAWYSMKQRCYNKSRRDYAFYGARGIQVCPEWQSSFTAFFTHMGKAPAPNFTLDRIDSNKNYEPGNCRWATQIQQQNNKRSNRKLCFNNRTLTISQWARLIGCGSDTLRRRLAMGWSIEEALTRPLKQQRNSRNLQKEPS